MIRPLIAAALTLLLSLPALAQSPADISAKLDKASPATLAAIAKLLADPAPAPKPEPVLPPGDDDLIVVTQANLVVDAPQVTAAVKAGVSGTFQILAYPPQVKPEPGKPWKPVAPRAFKLVLTEQGLPDPVDPPKPDDPPVVVPITDTGLRALIVYDNDTKQKLPRGQLAIIDSSTLRTKLSASCTKTPEGVPEWRIVPSTVAFNADQPIWQKLMAVPRPSLPWLLFTDGKKTDSIPLPATEADVLKIVDKYKGQ